MTMTTTLVARARHQAGAGPTWRLDILLRELADSLEAQAAKVAELEEERDTIIGIAADCDFGATSALDAFSKLLESHELAVTDRAQLGRDVNGLCGTITELQARLDRKPAEPRPMSKAPARFEHGQAVTFKHHGAGPLYGHVTMRGDSLVVVDKHGEWARIDSLTDVRATTTTAPGGSEWPEHGEGWSDEAMLAGGSGDESDA